MSVTPAKETVPTLDSLLMRTGPLDKLLKDTTTWTDLAKSLSTEFLPKAKAAQRPEYYVAHLCTAYYAHGRKRFPVTMSDATRPEQVETTIGFLETFMSANGQWPYIKAQPWFTSGDYVIAVDVNYYPDRSGFKAAPVFHKDTGGNNIFVNLIFDNKKDIEATEWFADLAKPGARRTTWQQKFLPLAHLEELGVAREVLRPVHGNDDVHGGVAEGQNVYVSWVDDLVWHSTPSTTRRTVFGYDLAMAAYDGLNSMTGKGFYVYDAMRRTYTLGTEVLGTMAECENTHLRRWLTDQQLEPQDVNDQVASLAWAKLYTGDAGKDRFRQDVRERAQTKWLITGAHTEANAEDSRLPLSQTINEPAIGMSGRNRANSVDQAKLEKVRLDNEGVPRSFIRTWVRILPKDSKELTDNRVVFLS